MEADLKPGQFALRLLWCILKLALALALMTPGQPFIYQGY